MTGLQFSTTATIGSNVGIYTITPFGASAPTYYLVVYTPGTLTINPASLTISANSASRLYGAGNPAFSASYNGLVNDDTSSVVSGLTIASAATPASNVGSYAITPTGAAAPNYTIAFAPGTLSITPAPLTIAADSKSRAFDVVNPILTASYTGFVNGDTSATVSGLMLATTAVLSSPVGNYPITVSGATASNYAISYVSGILAVGQDLLTIAADNQSKIYGAALPAFTASYAGFVNGDTASVVTGLQFSTTATVGSNVGTYTITPFGATAANYLLAYVPGTLTINPAALTITANSASRLYGTGNPVFGASYAGFVNGDTSAVLSGLTIASAATAASNVGSYAITPFGAATANYTIGYVPGSLTINPAPLTVAADNATRAFDTANPVFTATISGLVNGDSTVVVSGLTFSTPAVTTSPAGVYAIVPGGAEAANYTLAYIPGALQVSAPTVTVGTLPQPVVTVNQQPLLTPTLAVVLVDGNPILVPVNAQGVILTDADGSFLSVNGSLTLTLDDATARPTSITSAAVTSGSSLAGFASAGGPNFGVFEVVSSVAGEIVAGGSGGRLSSAQQNEPGLFRESMVNMGGFNVIYHEELAEARQQAQSNTALGSSYREFSDSDNPQTNIVRTKIDRKPANRAASPNS